MPLRHLLPIGLALAVAGCHWDDPLAPVEIVTGPKVHVGDDFACAVGRDQHIRCWGAGRDGQLGDGIARERMSPTIVAGDHLFASMGIHGAARHACAVTTDGEAWCWGDNRYGQLGTGSTTSTSVPVRTVGSQVFRSISAGWRFTCAVTVADEGYCWGRGVWGQLGNGQAALSDVPVAVDGDHRFAEIEVGTNNLACGLTRDARIFCWGLDWSGALASPGPDTCTRGTVSLPCAATPLAVLPERHFRDVAVGQSYACAIDTTGALWCWGANHTGQLGVAASGTCPAGAGEIPCNPVPTRVPGMPPLASVTAGVAHTCAVSERGTGFCWGRNQFGEVGDGQVFTATPTPTRVRGELRFASISAGSGHTCGATRDGALYCWGLNHLGQIGDGTINLALEPSRVVESPGAN